MSVFLLQKSRKNRLTNIIKGDNIIMCDNNIITDKGVKPWKTM